MRPLWKCQGVLILLKYVIGINIEGYTIQSGDEIAVFDNNRMVGAGVITTKNKSLGIMNLPQNSIWI